MTRPTIALIAAVFCLSCQAPARGDEKPPELTEAQKTRGYNVLLEIRNAQLTLQLAQTNAAVFFESLKQPGWKLDVNTMTYTKDTSTTKSAGK